jgi:hypothetical protein
MARCNECKKTIPPELLSPLMTSDGAVLDVCGVCALSLSNMALGIERTKFQGEVAEAMRQSALQHYKLTNQ